MEWAGGRGALYEELEMEYKESVRSRLKGREGTNGVRSQVGRKGWG